MNIQKELFDLFQKRRNDYELYEELKKFINKVEYHTQGEISSKYYSVLSKCESSINNAGHEERRSNDIDYLKSEMRQISDEFEDFLP